MKYTLTIECETESELKSIMTAIDRHTKEVKGTEVKPLFPKYDPRTVGKITLACPICGNTYDCGTLTPYYFCHHCGQKIRVNEV